MTPLGLVALTPLMQLTRGNPHITVGLIDGPVDLTHPDLEGQRIRELSTRYPASCRQANSAACVHGTFVAGILAARRDSSAPAICPSCTFLVRPIFAETTPRNEQVPSTTPEELASAVIATIDGGARVLNLSAALAQPSMRSERRLEQAFDYAGSRGAIVVAAAGNQGTLGSSVITRHPWVLPVTACDLRGRPSALSNLSHSAGRRGLGAPGEGVTSLGTTGRTNAFSGTSTAAPFVTGTIALLWSAFPDATAAEVRLALTQSLGARRKTLAPPVLHAWGAYQRLKNARRR
jgi:subtilisin family serine protease